MQITREYTHTKQPNPLGQPAGKPPYNYYESTLNRESKSSQSGVTDVRDAIDRVQQGPWYILYGECG